MRTSVHTLSHRLMPHSLSQLNTDKVSLMTKRNTKSIEIKKWLKKQIAGDFLRAGNDILLVDSKLPCNVCTQAHHKIVLQSSNYITRHAQSHRA